MARVKGWIGWRMGALVALLLLAGWIGNASAFTITQIGTSGGEPGGQPVYNVAKHIEKPNGKPYAIIEI